MGAGLFGMVRAACEIFCHCWCWERTRGTFALEFPFCMWVWGEYYRRSFRGLSSVQFIPVFLCPVGVGRVLCTDSGVCSGRGVPVPGGLSRGCAHHVHLSLKSMKTNNSSASWSTPHSCSSGNRWSVSLLTDVWIVWLMCLAWSASLTSCVREALKLNL